MAVDVSTELDLRQMDAGFRKMLAAARNLKPVFRKLEIPMELDQESHFQSQSGPDGKWAPRAESTKRRNKRGGRRNRGRLLGKKMKSSYRINIKRKRMEAESLVPWAEIHQYGGTGYNGARIPARPHIWLSETFLSKALPEIRNHLVRRYGRSG